VVTSPRGDAVAGLGLDPIEARALATAIERLPARAAGGCGQPLTPSLRAVLDRFLSTPLRVPLRSLGSAGGPVAVTIDGLPVGADPRSTDSGPDPTDAVAAWLTEAAGLFPAPDRRAADVARQLEPDAVMGWSDHLLVLATEEPVSGQATIRCAPLDDALAELDQETIGLLTQHRYRPTGARPNDPPRPGPVLASIGSIVALTLDPRAVVGLDHRGEAARQALLATLGRVAVDIGIRSGTGVLADRRRCLLDPDLDPGLDRPWLLWVDLVVDPLATFGTGGQR